MAPTADVLPCFCVPNVHGYLAGFLWVRRRGLLIRGLCLRGATHIVETTKPFWNAMRRTQPNDGVPPVSDEKAESNARLRVVDPGAWNTRYFAATALGHSVKALRRHEGCHKGDHTVYNRSMRLSSYCQN